MERERRATRRLRLPGDRPRRPRLWFGFADPSLHAAVSAGRLDGDHIGLQLRRRHWRHELLAPLCKPVDRGTAGAEHDHACARGGSWIDHLLQADKLDSAFGVRVRGCAHSGHAQRTGLSLLRPLEHCGPPKPASERERGLQQLVVRPDPRGARKGAAGLQAPRRRRPDDDDGSRHVPRLVRRRRRGPVLAAATHRPSLVLARLDEPATVAREPRAVSREEPQDATKIRGLHRACRGTATLHRRGGANGRITAATPRQFE